MNYAASRKYLYTQNRNAVASKTPSLFILISMFFIANGTLHRHLHLNLYRIAMNYGVAVDWRSHGMCSVCFALVPRVCWFWLEQVSWLDLRTSNKSNYMKPKTSCSADHISAMKSLLVSNAGGYLQLQSTLTPPKLFVNVNQKPCFNPFRSNLRCSLLF